MYYQNYEDYMRAVLGYPTNSNEYSRNDNYFMEQIPTYINDREIEEMYPQIYRTINPLVCNACDGFSGKLTQEILDNMVEDIYSKVETNNEIMIKINIESRDIDKNEKVSKSNLTGVQNRNSENLVSSKVSTSEDRRTRRNPLLQDLIKILLLNRLLGGSFPNRPPRPPYLGSRPPQGGQGGRPPFPPPGGMPPRPRTLMPSEYNNNYTNF